MLSKQRISNLLNRDIVKVSSWTGISSLIRIASQFLSAKVLAVLVGPAGVATLGQLSNAMGIAMAMATAAMTVGVTKYIAGYHDDPQKQREVIQTASSIIGLCTLVISVVCLLGAPLFNTWLFGHADYTNIIRLLGLTLSLYAFHTLWVAILNGYNAFKKMVIINIITSVAGLLLTVGLVYFFNITGAMTAFVLGQTLICIVTWLVIRKEKWYAPRFRFQVDPVMAKRLFAFTIMTVVATLVTPIVQLIIRGMITRDFSLQDAGIWEGMNRISANYLLLITSTVSVYYLPRLSALTHPRQIRHEIATTCKLVLPLLLLMGIAMYLLRHLIIRVLFSADFLPMSQLFAYQLIGDFLKVSAWLIGYLMWAKGYAREMVISELAYGIFLTAFTYFCTAWFGFKGCAIAYCFSYALYLVLVAWLMQRRYKMSQSTTTSGQLFQEK